MTCDPGSTADDVLNHRELDGDLGSDRSSPQSRAAAAGYLGTVQQTVAINPALAISGVQPINQWYANPVYLVDRTVVDAVCGHPA